MKPKMRVHLSYASEDAKVAGVLRAGLAKAGFEVWDVAEQLMPGDNWALELGKALQRAQVMVVLLSPASLASKWVRGEIEYALGDERFKGRLVPVVVRSVKAIPWILEKLDVLRIESNPERQSQRVVEALRRIPERGVVRMTRARSSSPTRVRIGALPPSSRMFSSGKGYHLGCPAVA